MTQTTLKLKRLKLHGYGHSRAVFCCRACREGFREDRKTGLIYGPYWLTDLKRYAMDAEEYSALTRTCPYCNSQEGMPLNDGEETEVQS